MNQVKGGDSMATTLGNLSKMLWELKQTERQLNESNSQLQAKVIENEENLVFTMEACTELYEMLLCSAVNYSYESEGVEKMSSAMVNIYVNLVKRGVKTLNDVPNNLREEVEKALNEE